MAEDKPGPAASTERRPFASSTSSKASVPSPVPPEANAAIAASCTSEQGSSNASVAASALPAEHQTFPAEVESCHDNATKL